MNTLFDAVARGHRAADDVLDHLDAIGKLTPHEREAWDAVDDALRALLDLLDPQKQMQRRLVAFDDAAKERP